MRILQEPLAILRAHTTEVHALLFLAIRNHSQNLSPTSLSLSTNSVVRTVLISGSIDGTIVVWDTTYYQQLCSWYGHSGGILHFVTMPPYTTNETDILSSSSANESASLSLSLKLSSSSSYGIFFSQGRDGCIHQWKLTFIDNNIPSNLNSNQTITNNDSLAFLDDLIPTSDTKKLSSSMTIPSSSIKPSFSFHYEKIKTIRMGFGTFCRINILSLPHNALNTDKQHTEQIFNHNHHHKTKLQLHEEEEQDNELSLVEQHSNTNTNTDETIFIIGPSLDAAKLSVWDVSGSNTIECPEVCLPIAISPEDAMKVSQTLGRKQPNSANSSDSIETNTDILQGLFRQSGMVMCTKLIPRPSTLPAYINNPIEKLSNSISSSTNQSSETVSTLDSYIQERYRTPDGQIRHPDAGSLKELLQKPNILPPELVPNDDKAKVNNHELLHRYRLNTPISPFLVIACYENGALYVIDPLLIHDTNLSSPLEIPALITLPISTDPLLTFALIDHVYTKGIVGTSGSLLYTIQLDYTLGQGSILQQINLPTPGCSISLSLPFSIHNPYYEGCIVGCWDNNVRYISLPDNQNKEISSATNEQETSSSLVPLSSPVHTILQWHNTGIQSIAIANFTSSNNSRNVLSNTTVTMASGAKDGRIAIWSMNCAK